MQVQAMMNKSLKNCVTPPFPLDFSKENWNLDTKEDIKYQFQLTGQKIYIRIQDAKGSPSKKYQLLPSYLPY